MQPAGTTLQPASLIFMLGGVDTDALPMLRHSRQGVNYHDLAIREALEALREREEYLRPGFAAAENAFGFERISALEYDVAIGLGLLVIPAVEISKWIRRKFA